MSHEMGKHAEDTLPGNPGKYDVQEGGGREQGRHGCHRMLLVDIEVLQTNVAEICPIYERI